VIEASASPAVYCARRPSWCSGGLGRRPDGDRRHADRGLALAGGVLRQAAEPVHSSAPAGGMEANGVRVD